MSSRVQELYGMTLHVDDMVDGYVDVVDAVMRDGRDAAPRGANTREVVAATIIVPASAPMLPVGTGRKVNSRLAAVEALQVIGGYSDPAAFDEWPHMRSFMDQGAFHGAYGPRIRPQVEMVLRRLKADPQTRRAVISVWDPLRDAVDGVHNYPCTTELQFMVRSAKLDMHVTMRANDAWHGLAYDAFVFSQLQLTIAKALRVEPGYYVHHAKSLHVYEEHWELTEGLSYNAGEVPFLPSGLAGPATARMVSEGKIDPDPMDPSTTWYLEKTRTRFTP